MARFNFNEADNYGGQGGGGYFSLKDDGDVARVRFMYESIEDMEGYAVHEAQVGDRKRYVNCLRSYNEPIDNCPFCKSGNRQIPKLFIPIYNIDEDRTEIWDRGKSYFQKLSATFGRFAKDKPLCATVFEIERHGKKGDQKTDYVWYNQEVDNTTLADLPELPEILGGLVLDKSADDMNEYIRTGSFPGNESSDDSDIRRRPSSSDRGYDNFSAQSNDRRTPSDNNRRGRW